MESVSGHRRPAELLHPLVIAARIECQLAEDRAVFGDDADMGSGDEQKDRGALVLVADVEVMESTQVAHGHATAAVEPVATNSILDSSGECGGSRLEPGL